LVKEITISNFFKATVRKITELSRPDFKELFTWPSNSTINAENPNLLIAKAANERGEVVAYVTAEPLLLCENYVLNPQSSREDDKKAGDAIDAALVQAAGVQRMWFVVPTDASIMEGEKFIRVLERKVRQPVTAMQRLGCFDLKQQPSYLN